MRGNSWSQSQHESAKADAARAQGTTKQGETQQPPIVVNVLPASKTEEETKRDEAKRKQKAELDRRLVDLTADLARYTRTWHVLRQFSLFLASGLIAKVITGIQFKNGVEVQKDVRLEIAA